MAFSTILNGSRRTANDRKGLGDLNHEVWRVGIVLGHVAVSALDAALGVVAPQAHVTLAGLAIRAAIRTADGGDDQVALLKTGDAFADCVDSANGFMTDDEHSLAGRSLSVLALVDLSVGAVDANLQHAHAECPRLGSRLRQLYPPGARRLPRRDSDRFHRLRHLTRAMMIRSLKLRHL